MINVKIQKEVYELPESWSEISVETFIKINSISVKSDIDYQLHLLALLMNIDVNILYDNATDTKGMIKLIQSLSFLNQIPEPYECHRFKYNYKTFTNFKEITFGDWISIETLIKSTEPILAIITILLKDRDGEHTKDIDTQIAAIKQAPITLFLKPYKDFLTFRDNIYKMYSGYFKMKDDSETLEQEIDKRAGLKKTFDISKWMWMVMVDKLCKELNYNPEQVYKMNMIGALNWLSLYHQKEQVDKQNK